MRTFDQFDIAGRSALVTGAASGIGLAYAEVLAGAGARVTLTDIDRGGVEREAERLRGEGFAIHAAALDVADRTACGEAFDAHAAAYGGLDICFANAGVGIGPGWVGPAGGREADGQVDTYDAALWDQSIAINLTGAYNTQVRNRGKILLLGLCTRPDTINTFAMFSKEVRLVTSAFSTRRDYEDALDALSAGAAEPRLLVTDTIGLDATPATFEALKRRTHQCKVLIAP